MEGPPPARRALPRVRRRQSKLMWFSKSQTIVIGCWLNILERYFGLIPTRLERTLWVLSQMRPRPEPIVLFQIHWSLQLLWVSALFTFAPLTALTRGHLPYNMAQGCFWDFSLLGSIWVHMFERDKDWAKRCGALDLSTSLFEVSSHTNKYAFDSRWHWQNTEQ